MSKYESVYVFSPIDNPNQSLSYDADTGEYVFRDDSRYDKWTLTYPNIMAACIAQEKTHKLDTEKGFIIRRREIPVIHLRRFLYYIE